MGVPGLGPYCATKWAIEGLTESLSQELEGFGCKATIVEIGNVQQYYTPENTVNYRSYDPSSPKKWGHLTIKSPTIDDYIRTPVVQSKGMFVWLSNRQHTDPQKVGDMIWQVHTQYFHFLIVVGTLWKSTCTIGIRESRC